MKQNITLSIDKELIKSYKVLAAQRQTSINRMLGEKLQKLIEDSKEYQRAKKYYICGQYPNLSLFLK